MYLLSARLCEEAFAWLVGILVNILHVNTMVLPVFKIC